MWAVAIVNNLPEFVLGVCWTSVVFWTGRRFERWRTRRGTAN